jgi:hypothetical protein
MRMSVMGQGRARVGCCSVAGTDCSAPAAILDAFLRLEEKGIVKPGESKKGLEMGIRDPLTPLITVHRCAMRVFDPTAAPELTPLTILQSPFNRI